MYENLAGRLKNLAMIKLDDNGMGNIPLSAEGFKAIKEIAEEAADAIEELSRAQEQWIEQERKVLLKSLPRWIPVTERLPKTRASILGKKSSKVIVAFRFDDGTQGTDTAHTLNGKWVFEDHITVVERTITHWMPLPEPPKEEQ